MADPLSDVFRTVHLAGGVFLEADLTAPWCLLTQITPETCRPFMPDANQVVAYHVVLAGRMLVDVEGKPPIEARAGEIVLFPRNDPHTLASDAGVPPVNAADLLQQSPEAGMFRIRHGGGGEPTTMVCGFLGTKEAFNPLLAALPRLLRLDVSEAASREWVESSVRFAAAELARGRLASSDLVSRLSEVLLVEAVREYIATIDERQHGWVNRWLRGFKDPGVGRALALIHGDVAAPWSATSLSKEVALSRTAFMERFTQLIGIPPIRYLTIWRIEIAKRQLRDSKMSIPQIAENVGYESEEGFRRAFKREAKMWPAEWRDRQAGR